jgi:hypothetical protein
MPPVDTISSGSRSFIIWDFGMDWFKRVHELVHEVANGRNGKLLQELICLCTPYVVKVRRRLGFQIVPLDIVKDEVVSTGVHMAIVRLSKDHQYFFQLLQNEARNALRKEKKAILERQADRLAGELLHNMGNDAPGLLESGGQSVLDRVTEDEIERLARRELEEEDAQCQRIINLWTRGSGYGEIEQRLGLKRGCARAMRDTNIKHMTRRMKKRDPGLFD